MQKKYIALFVGIILLAAFLRLWQLGNTPVSPDWDEVSLGYNAYSISQTGKDEYGNFLPIILRSYNDYKPALYAYVATPFTYVFGLTEFAIRLPSAIFGVLTVLVTFFLVKELFSKALEKEESYVYIVALLSSALLAISPWHIQFSRVAFEANLGLSCNILGIYFFVLALRKQKIFIFSTISFAIGFYTYQSEKVFVPLIITLLFLLFYRKILRMPKKFVIGAVFTFFLLSIPIFYETITNTETLARARGVSFISETDAVLTQNNIRFTRDAENKDYIGYLLDNNQLFYFKKAIENYLSHFNLNWLFIRGDTVTRHHAPDMGLLYLWELPFLLVGIYQLIFGRFRLKIKLLLFSWVFVTPLAASVTIDVPHSVRTLNFLPTFQIFTAIGIAFVVEKISNLRSKISIMQIKYLLFLSGFSFITLNFTYYLNQYFFQQNYFYAQDWQYGYKEVVKYIKPIENKYKKIVVSNQGTFDQSYMFFLFYYSYNPHTYLAEGGSGVTGEKRFSNFLFTSIGSYYDVDYDGTLFVGSPSDFNGDYNVLKSVTYPDKRVAMVVAEKK